MLELEEFSPPYLPFMYVGASGGQKRETVGFPASGLQVVYEIPIGPLEVQQVLLTVEPSHQSGV